MRRCGVCKGNLARQGDNHATFNRDRAPTCQKCRRWLCVECNAQCGGLCLQCGVCPLCCQPYTKENQPTKDHIVPLSRGGQGIRDNLRYICRQCNKRKGNYLDEELGIIWPPTGKPQVIPKVFGGTPPGDHGKHRTGHKWDTYRAKWGNDVTHVLKVNGVVVKIVKKDGSTIPVRPS
jgi:5-methylcytosine-specific restriction endonuclease McrA